MIYHSQVKIRLTFLKGGSTFEQIIDEDNQTYSLDFWFIKAVCSKVSSYPKYYMA